MYSIKEKFNLVVANSVTLIWAMFWAHSWKYFILHFEHRNRNLKISKALLKS